MTHPGVPNCVPGTQNNADEPGGSQSVQIESVGAKSL